ncbi:MAG: prepilin peptidase [Synergistaceae bacterium]|nr:prepilin peptidase [Synergistaceae bacterium]
MGSFLNVVAMRSISGKPWGGSERSACAECDLVLEWKDLVPLFSWLFLRGRCRRCGARISARYFAVEVIGAVAGGLLLWRWGFSAALPFAMTAAFGLFLNALTDIEDGYVFDVFPLAMGIIGGLMRICGGAGALLDGALGAAVGFASIGGIILLSRGGMGWGDATLAAGAGAILGWRMLVLTLYSGFMIGGVITVMLMIAGKVRRKDSVPLVPFLAAGGLFTLIAGPFILRSFGSAPGWPW